jgi:hypothetical protein
MMKASEAQGLLYPRFRNLVLDIQMLMTGISLSTEGKIHCDADTYQCTEWGSKE